MLNSCELIFLQQIAQIFQTQRGRLTVTLLHDSEAKTETTDLLLFTALSVSMTPCARAGSTNETDVGCGGTDSGTPS